MSDFDKARYREFLETAFWKTLSFQTKSHAGWKCERCGKKSSALQCHHLRYRASWEETKAIDLVVLCPLCHEREHGIQRIPVNKSKADRMKARKKARGKWIAKQRRKKSRLGWSF